MPTIRFGLFARRAFGATLIVAAALPAAHAQQRPPGALAPTKALNATPIPLDSLPAYVRTTPPTDSTIKRIWTEGSDNSQVSQLAQVLLDSIGPRLTGSPNMTRAQDWLVSTYSKWGVPVRKEKYGTWNSWERGAAYVQLTAPRSKTLEASMLSWSGNTNGQWIEGDVVMMKPYSSLAEYQKSLTDVAGKIVLASAPRLSCRSPQQISDFSTMQTEQSLAMLQRQIDGAYGSLTQLVPNFYDDLKKAGALAVFEFNWSQYPGVNRIFGSPRNSALPTIDIGCEDFGMLARLAVNGQSPRVKLMAESKFLGEQPVFNVIAEIKGTTRPDEYVVLSAHFDSWEGHSGATDNGTGSVTMLEAMRILKAVYPNPKRTIIVGHWSGEEQGVNGSGSFAADHPEIVRGLQYAFNQDNGTGRIVNIGPTIFAENGPRLAKYLGEIPSELTQWIRLQGPTMYSQGSDHVSWLCRRAPALNLNALSWDYSYTTWHTNRDSFDKVVLDDLRNNATLAAMLAYLASEDPTRSSREPISEFMRNGNRVPVAQSELFTCSAPMRKTP